MSSRKAPPLPAVVFANDLRSGDVVFRTPSGWSRRIDEAAVAVAPEDAAALEAAAQASAARQEIVDPYLVEVSLGAGPAPEPLHFRERFRVRGPSVRTDLGKQAEFGRFAIAAE